MPSVVLTFDNLGDAADRNAGRSAGGPTDHPSVSVGLPALLAKLDELELRATFCVEGENCVRYPDAVLKIAAHGHDLGLHGWRHERWSELASSEERAITEYSMGAFRRLGVPVTGFRPPGGAINGGTLDLLAEQELTWCSPEGADFAVDARSRVAIVPFEWTLVDALYLFEPFGELRRQHTGSDAPSTAQGAARTIGRELEMRSDRDFATLILHPFLLADPVVRAPMFALLEALAARRDAEEVTVLDARAAALALRQQDDSAGIAA